MQTIATNRSEGRCRAKAETGSATAGMEHGSNEAAQTGCRQRLTPAVLSGAEGGGGGGGGGVRPRPAPNPRRSSPGPLGCAGRGPPPVLAGRRGGDPPTTAYRPAAGRRQLGSLWVSCEKQVVAVFLHVRGYTGAPNPRKREINDRYLRQVLVMKPLTRPLAQFTMPTNTADSAVLRAGPRSADCCG